MLVKNFPSANLIPVPFPTTKYNNKPTSISPYPVYEYAASMFFTKDCKQPEIAMKWLNFLFTQQGQYLTNFGIEGQHYTLRNGKPAINDFYLRNPDGRSPSDVQRYIGCRPSIPFYMSRDFEEQIKALDPFSAASIPIVRAASRPPSFPSVMASPQEVNALRAVQSDFDTFVTEQISKFIMGERPIEEYDRFMSELDGMGLQEILKVKQAQYDRYKNMIK
jgi:putative aldouronate transport system substrate-binding protein